MIRWEGDDVANSWEPAHYLDACPDALSEYWSVAAQLDNVAGSTTHIVKEQLRRARKQSGIGGTLAVCGRGKYKLSLASTPLQSVTVAQLRSNAVVSMGLLQVYKYEADTASEHLKWCEGVIKRIPQRRQRTHRVYWYDDGSHTEVHLASDSYSTDACAQECSWFLFGTDKQLASIHAASRA